MPTIRIKGYSFSLSNPYTEGHSLTAAEAQALNKLREENISNNFRSQVNEQVSRLAPGELLAQSVLDSLQQALTAYDELYQFNMKAGRNRLGDIDKEILAVARERAIYQAGPDADLQPLIDEFVKLPAVIEEARNRVAAARSAIADGLESL